MCDLNQFDWLTEIFFTKTLDLAHDLTQLATEIVSLNSAIGREDNWRLIFLSFVYCECTSVKNALREGEKQELMPIT